MTDQQRAKHCGQCGAEAAQRCSTCKNIYYCTPECQQADWRTHKLLCEQFHAFESKRTPDLCRVILLPAARAKPTFAWIREPFGELVAAPREPLSASCRHLIGHGDVGDVLLAKASGAGGRLLDHDIMLAYRSDRMHTVPNEVLSALKLTTAAHRWGGSLVIAAGVANHDDSGPARRADIDTASFTVALDSLYVAARLLERGEQWSGAMPPPSKSTGIKLNPTPPYVEEIAVPNNHTAFKHGERFPVVEKLNQRLYAWTYPVRSTPPSVDTGTTFDPDVTLLANATYLRLNIDPRDPDFGHPPPRFLGLDGASVLLVDARRVGLTKALLEHMLLELRDVAYQLQKFPEEGRVVRMRQVVWSDLWEAFKRMDLGMVQAQ